MNFFSGASGYRFKGFDMEMQRGENPFEEPTRTLRQKDPALVAATTGGQWEPGGDGGRLLLPVLGRTFEVRWPEVSVQAPPGLDSFTLKLLCVLYLSGSDGTDPSGSWLAWRGLPGARFYEPVVRRSVEEPIAEAFGEDVAGFRHACSSLSGEALDMGDAASSFRLFPKVLLAFILWRADEEFDARSQVLFDSNDARHLTPFDLRMGAQEIASRLIKARGSSVE